MLLICFMFYANKHTYPSFPKVRPVNGFSRMHRERLRMSLKLLSILFTRYSMNYWQQKRIIIRCLLTINKIWNFPGIWNQSDLHPSSSSTGCIYCWRHRKLGQAHCCSRKCSKLISVWPASFRNSTCSTWRWTIHQVIHHSFTLKYKIRRHSKPEASPQPSTVVVLDFPEVIAEVVRHSERQHWGGGMIWG